MIYVHDEDASFHGLPRLSGVSSCPAVRRSTTPGKLEAPNTDVKFVSYLNALIRC